MTLGEISKKNSISGIKNLGIDAKSICAIIKACGLAGVSRLKLADDFEIEFIQDKNHSASLKQTTVLASQPKNKIEDHAPVQTEIFKISEDQDRIKEMDDFQVLMDDPLGFENQVIGEYLEGTAGSDRTKDFGPESDLHGS
jgi:hypothetical protein